MTSAEKAIAYVKKNKNIFIEEFASVKQYPSVLNPYTIFMAGSPGAGKTEFSESFNPMIFDYGSQSAIVRIDADSIRKLIQINGPLSVEESQPATSIIVHRLYKHIQEKSQSVIVDTTFSHYEVDKENVSRALQRNRRTGIFYIHLDPLIAWEYTKIRQEKESRKVSKEFFTDAYFGALETVKRIKSEYPEIELNLIDKKLLKGSQGPFKPKLYVNIEAVDNYLTLRYTKEDLINRLT